MLSGSVHGFLIEALLLLFVTVNAEHLTASNEVGPSLVVMSAP